MRLIKLGPDEFNAVLKTTRIKEQGEQVLRDLFVLGKSRIDVAQDYGLARQSVHQYATRFEKEFLNGGNRFVSPFAVVQAELTLPLAVIDELQELGKALAQVDDLNPHKAELGKLIKSIKSMTRAIELGAETENVR